MWQEEGGYTVLFRIPKGALTFGYVYSDVDMFVHKVEYDAFSAFFFLLWEKEGVLISKKPIFGIVCSFFPYNIKGPFELCD